ncbi:MAG TPA: PhoH family protein [Candidatus Binatia bacterium]|nr:PhoH family protein [Candidatus Binatia bacterium]
MESDAAGRGSGKIYVLDTSVIIYDHDAIQKFAEHDVAIPITVLEELDGFKKGNDSKNFSAREFIRFIDGISKEHLLQDWVPLNGPERGRFRVILSGRPECDAPRAEEFFDGSKADNKILSAALSLQRAEPEKAVILVTKDIALRLKAKALNLRAEDYEAGKVNDLSLLYSGKSLVEHVASELVGTIHEEGRIPAQSLTSAEIVKNHFFIIRNGKKSALGYFNAAERTVERIEKQTVYGVTARNAEQAFAVHALLKPEIKLVTLHGAAGTGKTLLALACALEQRSSFRQILVTRPAVPLGNKDIGFLPGDIASKLGPYMEPLWDNLKFIKGQFSEKDAAAKRIDEMLRLNKIEITPLTYIRGRSLSDVILIVDEAQNLTPHEVKTVVTRAGRNTKIVLTGDVRQIDTPYLDARSNGLAYLTDRLKGHELFAHVTLEKGERSELANLASDLL